MFDRRGFISVIKCTVRVEYNYRAHCKHKTVIKKDLQVNLIDWRVEPVLSSAEVSLEIRTSSNPFFSPGGQSGPVSASTTIK